MISIIATISKNAGVGYDVSQFPLDYFHRIDILTEDGVLVMGRITWDALPEDVITLLCNPYSNRTILVLTTRTTFHFNMDKMQNIVKFVSPKNIDDVLTKKQHKDVFILGGESLYAMFIDRAQRIYASIQVQAVQAGGMFPIQGLKNFHIVHYSDPTHIVYERITSCKDHNNHGEHAYLNILTDILNEGKAREDRTKVGTVAVFGRQMRFDISKSVPLLTTKAMGWKSIIEELLWFLQGKTDSKILENKKINIWKGNTTREFLDNRGLHSYEEGDTGPMYGFQWRHMGAEYKGAAHDYKTPTHQGHDQIAWLINQLRTDPYNRRHMITTYNPLDVEKGVLAPCHGIVVQFYVEDVVKENQSKHTIFDNRKRLSCHVYNRSQDSFLGMPYNIFSYAVLVHIIAKFTDMKPCELIISTGDTHIYSNHMEQCQEQIKRTPMPFPVLNIKDAVLKKSNGIDDLTIDDFELIGYISHPAIRAPMAV